MFSVLGGQVIPEYGSVEIKSNSARVNRARNRSFDLEKVWEGPKSAGSDVSHAPDRAINSNADLEKLRKESNPPGSDPSHFPDGGLEAWLATLGCWCAFFVSFGPINTIGIFQEYYQQELLRDYAPSTIAWISSTKVFLIFAGGVVAGPIFDSYGPRWLLLVGSALHVYGFMMTSISTQYYQIFLSQAICSAAGASCVYYACAGSLTTWFLKRRSTAFGIAATGSSIGGVVLPILVFHLIPKIGFPWAMRIIGFVIFILLIVTNLTVKSRIKHTPKPFRLAAYVRPFKKPCFSLLALSMALFVFGLFIPFNFLVLQAQSEGMSRTLSEYLIPILNAASTPGRILPGILADKMGNFNIMFITTLCIGAVALGLWLPSSSSAAIVAFAVIFGFFSGAYVGLAPMLVAQISKIHEIGMRNGALFFVISIAALTGGPVAGTLLNTDHGQFKSLQILAGTMMLAAAGMLLISRAFALGFTVTKEREVGKPQTPVSPTSSPQVTMHPATVAITSTAFLTSTFDHLKASASNATSSLNASAIFGRMPRWFGPLTDGLEWLRTGGSVVANVTGGTAAETVVQEAMSTQGVAASATAGSPAMETTAANALRQAFTFQHVRNFGGIFTYMTSKWALACFALAIVLNRTKIYTSGRRNIHLTFVLRLALRIAPIVMFLSHAQSLLHAIRCQSSPDYSMLKYENASRSFDLDFASGGGLLYRFSSTILFWHDDHGSCQAVEMVRTTPESRFKGSLSLLWPFFKTLCVGQFVETLSCAVQGRPIMTETGMSVFEHSLAFAEAEAMLSSHLGLSLFGSPMSNATRVQQDAQDSSSTSGWLTRMMLFDKLNTTPEVLLMAFISCLNNLSSHTLGLFNLQSRFRLLNTGIWGMCFLASFIWGFFNFDSDTDAGGITLRFPTVCIVGFIPHLLVVIGILGCALIYLIALSLAVLSPPIGLPRPQSWRERFEIAQDNLQANVLLSTIRVSMTEDFYTALLKVGFTALTVASEAVFLNEGKRIGVHPWTWLEEERLKEIQETRDYAKERLDNDGLAGIAGGVAMTETRPLTGAMHWISGYSRERTSKSLKPVPGMSARAEGDGVGALQRSGRYMGAWELLSGIFWLVTGWMALFALKLLRKLGFKNLPSWMKSEHSKSGEKRVRGNVEQHLSSWTHTEDLWMLSDNGDTTLPSSNDVDAETEFKKRLSMNSDGWGPHEERNLDSTLYNWWVKGGWWGDRDDSGDFLDQDNNDDLTSEISFTDSQVDDNGWTSDDSSNHGDGRTTPTQRHPNPRYDSRESSPFPDHALDPTHLALMLNPQNKEQRREAHMLSQHLSSDHIVTRSQYRRSTGHDRSHLLTSNPLNHPTGFRPSHSNGKLTPHEEAIVLEHLLLAKRAARTAAAGPGAPASAWSAGADGLGSSGPQCVVCQGAPRTVLAWPCRCLSLCEECRVSLAMNNFGTCVCCRQEVVGFSRLFVP
ncbi:MAG: hypothetical protein Q9216_003015 [Gyalolechia sp. 2 TL-2023]